MSIFTLNNAIKAVSDVSFLPISWANPTNSLLSDDVYSSTTPRVSGDLTIVDDEVYLQTDDSVTTGNNKADTSTAWSTAESYISYGDENDKWGVALTPAIVNTIGFGVGISCKINTQQSARLYASNFSFNIPTSGVIRGIKVEVEKLKIYDSMTNATTGRVDHIRMTVYYGFPHLNHFG